MPLMRACVRSAQAPLANERRFKLATNIAVIAPASADEIAAPESPRTFFAPESNTLRLNILGIHLPNRSCSVLMRRMDAERLSAILLNAPVWARLGLTVPDHRLRERAADALAATIVRKLEEPAPVTDRNQLALPL